MARVQVDVEGGVRKHTERFGLDRNVTDSTKRPAHNVLDGVKNLSSVWKRRCITLGGTSTSAELDYILIFFTTLEVKK